MKHQTLQLCGTHRPLGLTDERRCTLRHERRSVQTQSQQFPGGRNAAIRCKLRPASPMDARSARGRSNCMSRNCSPRPTRAPRSITTANRSPVINLCSYNYLGLANHPEVIAAAHEALAHTRNGRLRFADALRHDRSASRAGAARSQNFSAAKTPCFSTADLAARSARSPVFFAKPTSLFSTIDRI